MGDDVALGDAPLRFEGTERETPPLVAEFDAAIGVCVDSAPLASKRERLGAGFDRAIRPSAGPVQAGDEGAKPRAPDRFPRGAAPGRSSGIVLEILATSATSELPMYRGQRLGNPELHGSPG